MLYSVYRLKFYSTSAHFHWIVMQISITIIIRDRPQENQPYYCGEHYKPKKSPRVMIIGDFHFST